VIDPARSRQHRAPGPVLAGNEAEQGVATQPGHGFDGAEHGPSQGLIRKGHRLHMIEDDVVRGVLGLADLLQHDRPLAVQFGAVEGRVHHHIADDIHSQRQILLQHLGVIGGVLARRIGVERAADGLDLLGDVLRAAPRRAFEQHMLDQMGDAVDGGVFLARAGAKPEPDRGGLDMVDAVRDHAQAVVEGGQADRHAAPCNAVCART
jgi:hypothetical protein